MYKKFWERKIVFVEREKNFVKKFSFTVRYYLNLFLAYKNNLKIVFNRFLTQNSQLFCWQVFLEKSLPVAQWNFSLGIWLQNLLTGQQATKLVLWHILVIFFDSNNSLWFILLEEKAKFSYWCIEKISAGHVAISFYHFKNHRLQLVH